MTQINLPTYEQVQDIANQFPISGGIDWRKENQIIFYNSTSGDTFTKILEVTGKGLLTSISQYAISSPYPTYLDLTIDNNNLISQKSTGGPGGNLSLNTPIAFNESLVIKVRTNFSGIVNTLVTYILD